jgi:hypothetical protein
VSKGTVFKTEEAITFRAPTSELYIEPGRCQERWIPRGAWTGQDQSEDHGDEKTMDGLRFARVLRARFRAHPADQSALASLSRKMWFLHSEHLACVDEFQPEAVNCSIVAHQHIDISPLEQTTAICPQYQLLAPSRKLSGVIKMITALNAVERAARVPLVLRCSGSDYPRRSKVQ